MVTTGSTSGEISVTSGARIQTSYIGQSRWLLQISKCPTNEIVGFGLNRMSRVPSNRQPTTSRPAASKENRTVPATLACLGPRHPLFSVAGAAQSAGPCILRTSLFLNDTVKVLVFPLDTRHLVTARLRQKIPTLYRGTPTDFPPQYFPHTLFGGSRKKIFFCPGRHSNFEIWAPRTGKKGGSRKNLAPLYWYAPL